jgi:hypothetical protein
MTDQRAQQLTDLTQSNTASPSDLLYIVTNPYTTANGSFSITVSALASSMVKKLTPANSTINVAQGTIYYDNSYLYIATAANILQRISLTSF